MKSAARTDQLIVALLEHGSLEKAGAALGVSEATAWRWTKSTEFQQKYRTARREAFSRSVARLQHASSAAVSTLLRVMLDKESPASSRVRAADCVLSHATRAIELEDIEARVPSSKIPDLLQACHAKPIRFVDQNE